MSKIRLYGSTSGYLELKAPAVSPDAEVEIPAVIGPFGKVLQVVEATGSSFTTTSGTYVAVTNASASITPSATSSKVLVFCSLPAARVDAAVSWYIRVHRGGTAVGPESRALGNSIHMIAANMFLDSPSTTSSTTYDIRVKRDVSGTLTIDSGARIILIEIGA